MKVFPRLCDTLGVAVLMVMMGASLTLASALPLNESLPLSEDSSSKGTVKKELKPDLPLALNNSVITTPAPSGLLQNTTDTVKVNETLVNSVNNTLINSPSKPDSKIELNPGAKWRGLLVFGTLAVLSLAYLAIKIHKKRNFSRSNDTSFYPNEGGEFKYGILLNNDEDHLEMANRPLTMNDSDDEETEIFNQERKKFMDNDTKTVNRDISSNIPTTSNHVYTDNPMSEVKLPNLNDETSSEDEDLLDLINNKSVLIDSVIDNNNSKSEKTAKSDSVFTL